MIERFFKILGIEKKEKFPEDSEYIKLLKSIDWGNINISEYGALSTINGMCWTPDTEESYRYKKLKEEYDILEMKFDILHEIIKSNNMVNKEVEKAEEENQLIEMLKNQVSELQKSNHKLTFEFNILKEELKGELIK